MHRDCPKKGNASSTLACCNCQLAEGEKAHPANYRSCRHAKEELLTKKRQGKSKNTTGRVFSSTFIKPQLSFAAALRGKADQVHQEVASSTREPEPRKTKSKQQEPGQSVPALTVNEISSGAEADKAASAFIASIASAYRLSTSKITLSELNNDLPGLDRLIKYTKRMRKLWQETRDPGCKKAVNWVSKSDA
jgi:hypothetical protein